MSLTNAANFGSAGVAVDVGELYIGGVAVTATAAELNAADTGSAGVVTASKAVVVDSNKDIGDFRNLDAVNFDAGSSGVVGTVDIFPTTAASGKTQITAANNAGDTTTTITNASQAGARTYTIPDAGASASFVMTEGAQTINGTKTIPAIVTTNIDAGASGTVGTVDIFPGTASMGKTQITAADNAGNTTTTITNASQAGARTYTIPDAGASASFVMTEGNQTIGGTKTIAALVTTNIDAGASGTAGTLDIFPATASRGKTAFTVTNNTGDTTTTINTAAQATTRTYTIPDLGASAGDFVLSATQSALGKVEYLPLLDFRNGDYTVGNATGSATTFKLQGTVGTATNLSTRAVQNTTETAVALFEVVLPPWYRAATNLTLTANVLRVVAAGTTLTTSIDAEVWLMADAGTAGSDICATSVISFTDTSAADKTFTITGTTLLPNSRLLVRITGVATEAGNTGTVTTQINSLRLS